MGKRKSNGQEAVQVERKEQKKEKRCKHGERFSSGRWIGQFETDGSSE